VCVGPAIGEFTLSHYGEASYFLLLTLFGVIGTILALYLREEPRPAQPQGSHGFFFTAAQDGYMSLMAVAVVFGAGFAAMSTFFPLYAKTLGLQAGVFFVCYGISLISMRLFLGKITDSMNRDKLIVGCLAGFGLMLTGTSQVDSMFQIYLLGFTFGLLQGLSYPTMMARMVDRAGAHNRGVVVALFTGSFGVGINLSTPAWGSLADSCGLSLMFLVGGIIMFAGAGLTYFHNSAVGNSSLEPKRRPS
jgi:predicted MFS family arabinose efflux permease